MGVLPTGFGKSIIFVMVPLVLDEMYPECKHTALVISPLKALMKDQVQILNRQSVKSVAIIEETKIKDVEGEDFSVVFASPESIILQKWRKVLKGTFLKEICLLVYDEAHCISSWGLDFRPIYRQITVLQSLFDVPNLILTATATKDIQEDIFTVLGFQESKTKVVAALPDRPNIFLHIQESTEKFEEELAWSVPLIKNGDKKVIVYVQSINHCYQIYLWLMNSFIDNNIDVTDHLNMFHAHTDRQTKDRVMEQFVEIDGKIKILVTTVAFGMGINIPNIDIVVHWGIPSSVLGYWQEVGRCARDGRVGLAICFAFKRSVNKCIDNKFKDNLIQNTCIRKVILKHFLITGMDDNDFNKIGNEEDCLNTCTVTCACKKCKCCLVCFNSCNCSLKVNVFSQFV